MVHPVLLLERGALSGVGHDTHEHTSVLCNPMVPQLDPRPMLDIVRSSVSTCGIGPFQPGLSHLTCTEQASNTALSRRGAVEAVHQAYSPFCAQS